MRVFAQVILHVSYHSRPLKKVIEEFFCATTMKEEQEKNRRNTTSQNIVGKGINKQEENKETEHNIYCEATIASNLIRQTCTYSTPSMCSSF